MQSPCVCPAFPERPGVSFAALGAVGDKVDMPQSFLKLTGQNGFLQHAPSHATVLRHVNYSVGNNKAKALSPSCYQDQEVLQLGSSLTF